MAAVTEPDLILYSDNTFPKRKNSLNPHRDVLFRVFFHSPYRFICRHCSHRQQPLSTIPCISIFLSSAFPRKICTFTAFSAACLCYSHLPHWHRHNINRSNTHEFYINSSSRCIGGYIPIHRTICGNGWRWWRRLPFNT